MAIQAQGFDWYGNLPLGVECMLRRHSESRRSVSWFMHRFPPRTETMFDQSSDPVISLELNASGIVERAVEGRWEQAVLTQDTLTLTPAFTACHWRWTGEPLDILDVYIPFELMQAAWSEHFRGDPARVNLLPKLVLEDESILLLLKSMLAVIRSRQTNASLLYETMTNHLICSLLCLKSEAIVVDTRPRSTLPWPVLQRVKAYVEDHLAEDISLQGLADVASVSRFHFLRLFQNSMGMTPHAYLTERRMVRACNLLLNTVLPVSEVAADCGFEDPSYFAARFRRLYKTSPRDFRRSAQ